MSYFYLLASALVILFQLGCQSFQSRNIPRPLPGANSLPQIRNVENPSPKQLPDDNAPGGAPDETEPAEGIPVKPRPLPDIPKIGIILGPGGSRVYAQIGVLQEFQKNKIPIQSIAGMELGSLVASLYAWRNSVNDVEWQMFKIKEDDLFKKNLITGKKTTDINSLNPIIKAAFSNIRAEDFKKPFSCPALNLQNNQIYIMNKGFVDQLLPFCLPFPPFFKPYRKNISSTRDLKVVADYLRSQGANYVIFVNVLGGNSFSAPIYEENSTENLLWAELSSQLSKQSRYVDYTITLNLENNSIIDFSQRREMMQKGSDQSYKVIQSLAQKLGL